MSNCFKRDVTKLQTMKLKIDRMRRKKNPLGWALPQQSNEGEAAFELYFQNSSSCISIFRSALSIPLLMERTSPALIPIKHLTASAVRNL
ncbi:hypothetical protein T07_2055 [Trichinella nelsoni]|uniref:Uncharacterized protein n=1 Tax=Trichinella nelsoni TaxID=6336 RepID=A0A0V0RZQ3_9BILA|nr:hypothetical protein T07_2055 [Trichinella nelsoni]